VVVVLVLLYLHLTMGSDHGTSFNNWLLTGGTETEGSFDYYLAILVLYVPFFSFTVYYFTAVRHRLGYLTLISLIPFVLYIKTYTEIKIGYLAPVAMLNIIIYVLNSLKRDAENGIPIVGKRAAAVSSLLLTVVALLLAAVIPKPDSAPLYSYFEKLFMNGNIQLMLDESYSQMSEHSGNADNYDQTKHRRMYTVYARHDDYYKRQTFDLYDFQNDNWYPISDYSTLEYMAEDWGGEKAELNLKALKNAIVLADNYSPGFIQRYFGDSFDYSYDVPDFIENAYVQSHNFGAVYYLSTVRSIGINVRMASDEQIYVTRSGVFRNKQNRHPKDFVYQVISYNTNTAKKSWIDRGYANISVEAETDMLTEMESILSEHNDNYAYTADAFLNELKEARQYKQATNEQLIYNDIAVLANDITKDCTYDYEKAEALEQYFYNNDFVYDLDYIAEDTSPEYFLFTSKRGTCSDFASAYTLMARAVGLTVRYAEGYHSEETEQNGVYAISDSNSHAYPEVYIPNTGWLVYEPTVPVSDNTDFWSFFDKLNFFNLNTMSVDFQLVFWVLVSSVPFALAIMLFVVVLPAVKEWWFCRSLSRKKGVQCLTMAYNGITDRLLKGVLTKPWALTPYELAQQLATLVGCDIEPLALRLEAVLYGGSDGATGDEALAVESYSNVKRAVKLYKKQKRSEELKRIFKREKNK
jgi:hypothetical protein